VFIKYYSGKSPGPGWKKLMKDFADNEEKLVAAVDCSGSGKPLCDSHALTAGSGLNLPAYKYGEAAALQDYTGKPIEKNLRAFIEDEIYSCSVSRQDLCSAHEKAMIKGFERNSMEKLISKIKFQEGELKKVESGFKQQFDELDAAFKAAAAKKDKALLAVKESDLYLMKVVRLLRQRR
jgi:hypothetical protein